MEQKERGMIKRLFDILGIFKPFPLIIHFALVALVTCTIVLLERHTNWHFDLSSYLIGLVLGIVGVNVGISCSRRPE